MSKQHIRYLVASCLVGCAITWWAATSNDSPIKPHPQRPVLKFLARVAKVSLWVLMFADNHPHHPWRQQETQYATHHTPRYDADGHRVLDHAQGW